MTISARTALTASALLTVSSNGTTAPTTPTLSQDDADCLLVAIRDMHGIVRLMGETLPVWEKCGAKDREAVVVRSLTLLQEKARHEREAKILSYKAKLSGVFNTHMVAAQEEKKAYDALPASLKGKLGAFPDTVKVPVSEVMAIFGEGLTEDQVVGNLSNLSFKVGKGKERGASAYIVLDFKPATGTSV